MVTLTAGMTSVTGQVTTLYNDNIYEGNEMFSLIINETSLPARVETSSNCVFNIMIVGIDSKCVSYYWYIHYNSKAFIYCLRNLVLG